MRRRERLMREPWGKPWSEQEETQYGVYLDTLAAQGFGATTATTGLCDKYNHVHVIETDSMVCRCGAFTLPSPAPNAMSFSEDQLEALKIVWGLLAK